MKILLTGASGFIGGAVLSGLFRNRPEAVRVIVRSSDHYFPEGSEIYLVSDLSARMEVQRAFADVDVVVHCAARVHITKDEVVNPLAEYRKVNVDTTLALARAAAESGVQRFVFLSSVKVNGEQTADGRTFSATDHPAPKDPYGVSKLEAEKGLHDIAKQTGMEVVIIRPPLVYGEGVKGNFSSLLRMAARGLPLPFGLVSSNKRSLVYVGNLVDLIITCIDHPGAENQTFLVSDDDDLSTKSLLKAMGAALGKKLLLVPVPVCLFKITGRLIGKADMVDRLIGSLQVDITHTKETLNWKPPYSVAEGMELTVSSFKQ